MNEGRFKKGQTAWNKGLKGYRAGYKHTQETINKMSKPHKKASYKTEASYRIRKTKKYYKWRKDIFNRDLICKKCGYDKGLHAHHIISIKEDISKVFDLSNGILLCKSCHAKEHDFGAYRQKFTGQKAEKLNGSNG